jgi:membrane protein DedA with SNARE-associated domain
MELGFEWIARHGYGAIFALLMLGIVGLPVPDETLLIFVGYLSAKGTLQVLPAAASAFLGSASGISLSYALGRLVGLPVMIKLGPVIRLRPEHLTRAQQWVERWGKYSLLVAYFIPGYRHLSALTMGASLLPPAEFARYAYTGALIWSVSFIALGYFAGEEWNQLFPILHRTSITVILFILFMAAIPMAWFLLRRMGR